MISAILLAGGKSSRMGKDKAFLKLGQEFVYRIANEMLKVSSDLIVVIGKKEKEPFEAVFKNLEFDGHDPASVRILNDEYDLQNPVGGILTGLENAKYEYAAIVGCDMPLLNSQVINLLSREANGYDCAVPVREGGETEPLCGVYAARQTIDAGLLAISDNLIGPKHLLSYIPQVNYVKVSALHCIDPNLDSLLNINYPSDYEALLATRKAPKNTIAAQLPPIKYS